MSLGYAPDRKTSSRLSQTENTVDQHWLRRCEMLFAGFKTIAMTVEWRQPCLPEQQE